MIILKYLPRLTLLIALVLLATSIWIWIAGHDVTKSAGEIWYELAPEGLNLVQAMIERYLLPLIWQQGVVRLLLKPFWETVFLLFIALLILATGAGNFSRRCD